MGHNDLCGNNASPQEMAAQFERQYTLALTEWDKRHQGATAFLIPIGEVHKVYEALAGYTWFQSGGTTYGCEDSWKKLFPYCPKYAEMADNHELTPFLAPRIEAMNSRLLDLARKWNHQSTRNHYRSAEHSGFPFTPALFAVDCYHLSANGQKVVAKAVYDAIH
jgi:hypothetical protein